MEGENNFQMNSMSTKRNKTFRGNTRIVIPLYKMELMKGKYTYFKNNMCHVE